MMTQLTKSDQVFNCDRSDVVVETFPRILKNNFLNPELYQRLQAEFPPNEVFDKSPTLGRRAGRDLYRGDPAYDELLTTSPAWREFYEYLNSSRYIDDALNLFGDYLKHFECKINPEKFRFVDYFENREYLASWHNKKLRTLKRLQQILTFSKEKVIYLYAWIWGSPQLATVKSYIAIAQIV